MTRFLLIRHASHSLLGAVLTGRMPGVHLSDDGHEEAGCLASALGRREPDLEAVYCGPLERARETAAPIARRLRCAAAVSEALDEIDFGEWTGASFAELDRKPAWHAYNARRSDTAAPGGESLRDAQQRAVAELTRLHRHHANATVAIVSHGDVLRAIVAHALDLNLDRIHRFEVAPASVSVVTLGDWHLGVTAVNDLSALRERARRQPSRRRGAPPLSNGAATLSGRR